MDIRHWTFQSGFTLIELLVVIGVVGALAVSVMTVLNPVEQIAKSRDAKRKSDLATIQKALELYYHDHGEYPGTDVETDQILSAGGDVVEWGSGDFSPYIESLPKDPDSSNTYAYESNGQSYRLFASLDRGEKDPAACKDIPCVTASSVSCGSECNYAVSSPNVSPDSP